MHSMNQFAILLLLSILPCLLAANQKLTIIGPKALSDQFPNDIKYSLAHYGKVPYGAHVVGSFILAEPINGCDPIEHFSKDETNVHINYIAVVRRGDCRVSIKSRNAQLAGAKMVLMVDNQDKSSLDDWFGHEHGGDDIKIPTMMIDRASGDAIINYLHSRPRNPNASENDKDAPLKPLSKIVDLDFWYSSGDRVKTSFQFLKRFHYYWEKNSDYIHFEPRIVTWTSNKGRKANFQNEERDCILGGRYCAPDPDSEGKLTGADVVKEDLRQLCIFREKEEMWWKYVVKYGELCLDSESVEKCGDDILELLASTEQIGKVKSCISASYVTTGEEKENKMLKEQKEEQVEYSINSYPTLFINYKPFYGKLQHAFVVFEEVCKNLAEPPADCQYVVKGQQALAPLTVKDHTGRIMFIVISLLLLSALIFCCCRRMIRKESRDMSSQVGGMVTRYFALKDTKEEAANDG